MKAYKGFNSDMTCRGFQYEEGAEYEHTGEVKACSAGYHACKAPLDCFGYYAPGKSVFHEVELSGTTSSDTEDTKIAASHIKIGARLDIADICKAQFDFVKSRCVNEHNSKPGEPATAGDYGAATAGDYGAATAGYSGAATAGYSGAATAGYSGAATAGDYGAATAGDYGAATAGYSGAATAGYSGAATTGYKGAATSRGKSASGENGLSVARGNNVMVRGGIGAVLVIAEEQHDSCDIKKWKAAVVDGEHIKADTWYRLEGDEFVEVKE